MKNCIKCNVLHPIDNFYTCYGIPRGECKECFKSNLKKSNQLRRSMDKFLSNTRPAIYFKSYYERNKDKFKEYSRKFRKNNPHYFKDYYRQRKEFQAKNVA